MRISQISQPKLSFKQMSKEYVDVLMKRRSFQDLSTDGKLNVIYDTLVTVDKNADNIRYNQHKMHDFNHDAFELLSHYSCKSNPLNDSFEKARLD